MMSTWLGLLLALAVQSEGAAIDCDAPMNQNAMNACAAREFEVADAELNRIWPEAIAAAREADRHIDREHDDRPTSEAMLREAQRAWILFRDAHCTWRGHEARGGSLEPLLYNGCRARITRERNAQLRGTPLGE